MRFGNDDWLKLVGGRPVAIATKQLALLQQLITKHKIAAISTTPH